MPADFELSRATQIVHSRGWGALTDDDVFGHMARIGVLFREGVLDAGWAQISDFTEVTDMRSVSSKGIRRMADANRAEGDHPGVHRRADAHSAWPACTRRSRPKPE